MRDLKYYGGFSHLTNDPSRLELKTVVEYALGESYVVPKNYSYEDEAEQLMLVYKKYAKVWEYKLNKFKLSNLVTSNSSNLQPG